MKKQLQQGTSLAILSMSPVFCQAGEHQSDPSSKGGFPVSAQASKHNLEVSVGGGYYDFDIVNGFGTSLNTVGFDFIDQSDTGSEDADDFGGNIDITWRTPLQLAGHNDLQGIVSLGYDFFTINTSRDLVASADGFVDVLPIDGSVSPGASFSPNAGDVYNQEFDYDYWRLHGVVGVEKPIGSNSRLGLSFYFSGGEAELSAEITDGVSLVELDEDITFISFGPQISWATDWKINQQWSVGASASFAALFSHGELTANQAGGPGPDLEVEDNADNFAILADISVSANYRINENQLLGIKAGIRYRNDVYEIINPRSGSGLDASDPASYNPSSAHIDRTDLINPYLNLVYTINF